MKIPELLAPAGTFETLIAVCNAGADAVYCAGTRFGARAFAGNLSDEELLKALQYTHLHGKKMYLTLNTLLKDSEINELYEFLIPLYINGLDGIIVQDLGVMEYIKHQFPLLPIHVSTQAAVMGVDGVNFFIQNGSKRVVLARELSLDEIVDIKKNTDIEIEVFVHGALCYSYSGMCLYSSMIGGRSGNRGRCAQPCRMEYSINGNTREWMSLKDLSALQILDKLCEAGIDSLKIEGRMKNIEYAAGVTSIYRKYLDMIKNGCKEFKVSSIDVDFLNSLYQRRGFLDGYFFRNNSKDMILDSVQNDYEQIESKADSLLMKLKKLPVDFFAYFEEGKESVLILSDNYGHSITVYGDICQKASNKALNEETVIEKLSRVNDSLISINSLNIQINGDLFLPLSALNNLRRSGIEAFMNYLSNDFIRETPDRIVNEHKSFNDSKINRFFSASFLFFRQGYALIESDIIKRIYFPYDLFSIYKEKSINLINGLKKADKEVYLSLPEVFRKHTRIRFINEYDELSNIFDGFLIKNIDELSFVKEHYPDVKCIVDFTVYSFNNYACDKIRNCYDNYTASLELNGRELKQLDLNSGELVIYGRYPMMFTSNCLIKNSSGCTKKSDTIYFKDRKKFSFFVKSNCKDCYNVIYNSQRTSLLGVIDELDDINVSSYRFMFTDEHDDEIKLILRNLTDPDIYTRGHYIRGVQ